MREAQDTLHLSLGTAADHEWDLQADRPISADIMGKIPVKLIDPSGASLFVEVQKGMAKHLRVEALGRAHLNMAEIKFFEYACHVFQRERTHDGVVHGDEKEPQARIPRTQVIDEIATVFASAK